MKYVVFLSWVVGMARICFPLNFVWWFHIELRDLYLNDDDAFSSPFKNFVYPNTREPST